MPFQSAALFLFILFKKNAEGTSKSTIDCKDKIRAPDWKPDWVKEGREPSFMGGDTGYRGPDWVRRLDPVAQGQDLYAVGFCYGIS